MNLDKSWIAGKAKEQGFVRDSLEKVYRLREILLFINSDPSMRDCLALKGGTAINLTIFDLPRLSVDIDLDYSKDVCRAEMEKDRGRIVRNLHKYMLSQGYVHLPKSKSRHILETMVYGYANAGGANDNIKIEINFLMRDHIYPLVRRNLEVRNVFEGMEVLTLDKTELFASKTKALLERGAVRDLYDIDKMVSNSLFQANDEREKLRKCTVFYMAIGNKKTPLTIDFSAIDGITQYMVKLDLLPMKRKDEHFNLDEAKTRVKKFIGETIIIGEKEKSFLEAFNRGEYRPDYLFPDEEILKRVKNHPTAIWKTSEKPRPA